jgi:hypothetical protein
MKIRVRMIDPDTLQDAIVDAVKADMKALPLSKPEVEAIMDLRTAAVAELAAKWFEYGEYLEVEIDTDADTCVVVPV